MVSRRTGVPLKQRGVGGRPGGRWVQPTGRRRRI